MIRTTKFILLLIFGACLNVTAQKLNDYKHYHQQMIKADQYIVAGHYNEALSVMDETFQNYDYIFLRDYQIATQVAAYIGNKSRAFHYLRAGMAAGWTLTDIKKNKILKKLHADKQWQLALSQYPLFRQKYISNLDNELRTEIQKMFQDDQTLASEIEKITDEKAQNDFIMKQFVPQNERQVKRIHQILLQKGYPGEKRIGNSLWVWTILSHHNSVSPDYVRKDTLYPVIRPLLLKALRSGELSPGDFAVIEDWRITVGSNHQEKSYGYLNTLTAKDLAKSNLLRETIGLPAVELRNQLVETQRKTGIDFYLEGTMWIPDKMAVHNK